MMYIKDKLESSNDYIKGKIEESKWCYTKDKLESSNDFKYKDKLEKLLIYDAAGDPVVPRMFIVPKMCIK